MACGLGLHGGVKKTLRSNIVYISFGGLGLEAYVSVGVRMRFSGPFSPA